MSQEDHVEVVRTSVEQPKAIATSFLQAFSAGDVGAMRALLADDLRALVTRADGEMDTITGREEYLGRIEAMDLPAVQFRVELTQEPVAVDSDRVLVMVEVRAHKDGRTLHNFAAHLLRVSDGRISEWHMVDAKPAESDKFWA